MGFVLPSSLRNMTQRAWEMSRADTSKLKQLAMDTLCFLTFTRMPRDVFQMLGSEHVGWRYVGSRGRSGRLIETRTDSS